MRSSVFYTYVDTTNDGRAFYVGKGLKQRLKVKERNKLWKNIVRKHGHGRRIVVFETLNEEWAFDREIELIALLRTRHGVEGHWGANLSEGGEGPTGYVHTPEARQKISEALHARVISEETRRKLSERQRGEKNYWATHDFTDQHKQRISEGSRGENNGFFGKKHVEATRAVISQKLMGNKCAQGVVRRGKRHTCKGCGQIGHYAKTCPFVRDAAPQPFSGAGAIRRG